MTTAAPPARSVLPADAEQLPDDELCHYTWCCDENRALCGTDLTGQSWAPAWWDTTCVVCADLGGRSCPGCGS